ncbi:MAG: hypothetical protein HYT75_03730 [Deltaproteobacteria bacterium]|nr:hypothetical protein [Deltaproteobacteria bacterium]
MVTGITKIDKDETAYLCAQDVFNTIGLSKADQDEFWTSDKYTDIAASLLDKCAELINRYGSGLHVERMAKKSEAIFEMDAKDWAYLPATGAEILFRSKDGFVFSDHMLNNSLRVWMGRSLVFFIDPPNPLYNHPARNNPNIAHESSLGPVKEYVDGFGRLVMETSVQISGGGNGIRYSIFDQDSRLVEFGYPAKYAGHDDKESVTKIEYDNNGNEIRRFAFEGGQLKNQTEHQYNLNGQMIKSIHTDYSTGQPVIEEYEYTTSTDGTN